MQKQTAKRILRSMAAVTVLLVLVAWIDHQPSLSVTILNPKFRSSAQRSVQGAAESNFLSMITLLADPDWLDDATKTIGVYWKRKNARRNGVIVEKEAEAGG